MYCILYFHKLAKLLYSEIIETDDDKGEERVKNTPPENKFHIIIAINVIGKDDAGKNGR